MSVKNQDDDMMNDEYDLVDENGFEDVAEEDDWADEAEADDSEQAAGEKKKSKSTYMVIALGVVAALGILYFQFSSSDNTAQAPSAPELTQNAADQSDIAALQGETPVQPQPVPDEAAPVPPQQGFMANPDQLTAEKPAETAPAQADAADQAGPLTPMPDFSSVTETQKEDSQPEVLAQQEPQQPPVVEPQPVVQATQPETAPVVAGAQLEASQDFNEIQSALSEALARIKQLESEVKAVKALSSSAKKAPQEGLAAGELASLRIAMGRLESRVEKLAAAPVQVPVQSEVKAVKEEIVAPVSPVSEASDKPSVQDPASEKIEAPSAPEVSASEASAPEIQAPVAAAVAPVIPKKSVKPAAAPVAVKESGSWQLRGAQPGLAVIGHQGEKDMRSVQVGDDVPGLGKIVSILQQNGRWVVQGTAGSIRQ